MKTFHGQYICIMPSYNANVNTLIVNNWKRPNSKRAQTETREKNAHLKNDIASYRHAVAQLTRARSRCSFTDSTEKSGYGRKSLNFFTLFFFQPLAELNILHRIACIGCSLPKSAKNRFSLIIFFYRHPIPT